MAVTITQSAQLLATSNDTLTPRSYPIDRHGKLRYQYGLVTQGAAAGDDGSQVEFVKLPQGRKRIIMGQCRYKVSALGAARLMKIGHRAYYDRSAVSASPTAEDLQAFASGIDVSAATNALFPVTTQIKFDMFSRDEITLVATVTGGTIPAGATFEWLIAYLYE